MNEPPQPLKPTTLREYDYWLWCQQAVAKASQSCHDCNGDSRELAEREWAFREALRVLREFTRDE